MCSVSLILKRGKQRSFNLLLRQGFASLCPCHDYFLEMFTRDKDRLFTLILLLLPSWRTQRRLLINSSTGPHLSLASGNAKRRLDDSKCPTWNPSISYCNVSCIFYIGRRVLYHCATWEARLDSSVWFSCSVVSNSLRPP